MSSVEWVETTGKTVEEAQEAALDQLGIDHDDAEFEVLEEPRAGLFGRVRGEARIRARVAPKAPRPKQERRPRRKPRSSGGRGRGGEDRGSRSSGSAEGRDQEEHGVNEEQADEGGPDDRNDNGRDGGRDGGRRDRGRHGGERRQREDDDRPILTAAEEGELVADFLRGLTDAFELPAEVKVSPIDDDTVQVDVDGDNLGLLVGPRGNTLSALHELSRTILQRKAGGGFQGRVRVDVAGYRAKRREALAAFVTQIADQVVSSGRASALEPMNPPDRKVVHDTANEIDGVTTRSEGEEPRRYVVIEPA